MGGSSKQVTGYRYFANFLLFIGNPIEKVLGINFDKRGWKTGKRVPMGTNGELCYLHLPNLYGENEGGVSGVLNIKHGSKIQTVDSAYTKYMNSISLPASAYPYQSYISFSGSELASQFQGMTDEELQDLADEYEDGIVPGKGFYLGNSGYMKEMLLWVKRTRIRNDGRKQWYEVRGDGAVVCEIGTYRITTSADESLMVGNGVTLSMQTKDSNIDSHTEGASGDNWQPELVDKYVIVSHQLTDAGSVWGENDTPQYTGVVVANASVSFEIECDFLVKVTFHTDGLNYTPSLSADDASEMISFDVFDVGGNSRFEILYLGKKGGFSFSASVDAHQVNETSLLSNRLYPFNVQVFYPRSGLTETIESPDINPIHKIREILTDDTAMNKPETSVNDVNFKKAADRIYDEGLGISWSITEKSCLEAIEELCGHIEAGVRVNRQTGLYEMVLFRDDWFEESEIHAIAVNKIKSMSLEVANADEAINQLNVSYYNRDAIKDSSFSISENASIRNLQGRVNAEDADFPYFMNQRNAAVVAQWKLKQMSSPVWKGSFTTAEYNARKWNRYDLLRLEWPRKWTGTILVRIMKINLGTGTDVSIDFVEVVPYSSDLSSSIVIDTPVDTTPKPPQPALFKAFELSYLEAVQLNGQKAVDEALAYNPDAGYAAVIAKRPQSNSLNALMYTDTGNDYERTGTIQYCETAALDQNISQLETSFIVKNAGAINMVNLGTQITINNEIMVYESYDAETKLLTVKRGALDTIPQNHLAGSVLYFADDFITVDPTEYVTGEIINVKTLTTTPSGILSLNDVDAQQVEIQARAIRPYPPANVKINDVAWPETLLVSTDLTVTWVHRNRLQQTGGALLSFYDGGIAVESGVTYSLELSVVAGDVLLFEENIAGVTLTIPKALIVPNKVHKLKLWAVRDGYTSYQVFEHSFFVEPPSLILTATTNGSSVVGNTVPVANISVSVDESLSANMKFDGSAISGKAEAGATITIEIQE